MCQLAEHIHVSADGVLPTTAGRVAAGRSQMAFNPSPGFAIFHSLPVNPLDKIRRVKPPNKQDSRTVMRIREDKAHARYFSEGPMPRCFCGLCAWSGWTQVRAHCPTTEMKRGHTPVLLVKLSKPVKRQTFVFFFRQIFLYTKQSFGFSQWI